MLEGPYGDWQLPNTPTLLGAGPWASRLSYAHITFRFNQCDSSDYNKSCRKRSSESLIFIGRPNRTRKGVVPHIAVNA